MKKPMTPEAALERLEGLCARSEQCVFDLRRKLFAWGISRDDSEKIVESLRSRRFVDDSRFAPIYCRDKYRFGRWGRYKIKLGLVAKHIDSTLIEAALQEIDEEVYRENLLSVMRAKARSLGEEANTYEGRTKLFRYGASRGYEPQLVIDIIRSKALWDSEA